MKHCIAYCIRVLLFENVQTLEGIKTRIINPTQRNPLEKQLHAVGDYLKHEFQSHIDTDKDPAHDDVQALLGYASVDRSEETTFDMNTSIQERRARTRCTICLKPFQFLANLEEIVCVEEMDDGAGDSNSNNGLRNVIRDAKEKFKLFMVHKLRSKAQQTLFECAQKEVVDNEAGTVRILTMDYKMKYQPKMFREKTIEWYGKKGLSWTGSVLTSDISTPNGGEKDKVNLKNLYLDHVCGNSTE